MEKKWKQKKINYLLSQTGRSNNRYTEEKNKRILKILRDFFKQNIDLPRLVYRADYRTILY